MRSTGTHLNRQVMFITTLLQTSQQKTTTNQQRFVPEINVQEQTLPPPTDKRDKTMRFAPSQNKLAQEDMFTALGNVRLVYCLFLHPDVL